jgi:uncharacterized membrane-anchored protein
MRRWPIIAIAVAQVALLAFMAGQREWVLRTGRPVWLRTAPLDPTDPMRGAYVRLGYEISRVPRELCRDGLAEWMDGRTKAKPYDWNEERRDQARLRDRQVYAVLREGPHGLAELVVLTDREPVTGLFLRGRVGWADKDAISVRYGIEALFLQQGKAKELELAAGKRTREDGVLLDAEVAVGGSGLAVLKGSRWEPLGITVTTELESADAVAARTAGQDKTAQPAKIVIGEMPARRARESSDRNRPVVAVTVELKNHGEQPLAIWAPADGSAFRLEPRKGWGDSRCRWVGAERERAKPVAADILILKPGESRKVRLDLTAAEWAVLYGKDEKSEERTVTLSELADNDRHNWSFLIEYRPPTAAECAGLPGADALWLKGVRSRAFSPTGTVD